MKYRKKPVVIEAIQVPPLSLTPDSFTAREELDDWMVENQGDRTAIYVGDAILIQTLEGEMRADVGDWIIRGVEGEIYPCKPSVFEATYEKVEQ